MVWDVTWQRGERVRALTHTHGEHTTNQTDSFLPNTVPKVYRGNVPPTAFLCKPDGSTDPIKLAPTLKDYIPRTDDCSSHTSRPAPYAIAEDTFAALHPEEATWLEGRLDKTAVNIQSFVAGKLVGKSLDATQARLRIAVANTGGGKRATMHALGVAGGLFGLGVFDHLAYVSGLSGGGWYVMAHFIAMLEQATVIDPAAVLDDIKEQLYLSVIGDDFDANSIFTDFLGQPMYYSPLRGQKNSTDEILCEGELKLQSPLTFSDRSASPVDYWARAITAQIIPTNLREGRGLDLTFSSFASSRLLETHSGPLPFLQIHELKGNGSFDADFRLWEFSPFDVSTNEGGNLHASFPTALLGSDAMSPADQCVVGLDNVGLVQGISSWAVGDFSPAEANLVCGRSVVTDKTACQAVGLKNPFQGFEGIRSQDPDLFRKPNVFLTDGGTACPLPVWMFLTPQRPSDIIFAVDGGGLSNTSLPTLSADTSPDPSTCSSDIGDPCPEKWPGTNCCNMCNETIMDNPDDGCFSVNTGSYLFSALDCYSTKAPDNTVPPYPAAGAIDAADQWGQRVKILGCHTVSSSTPIVTIPNRLVNSGHSGHDFLKGCADVKFPVGSRRQQKYESSGDILAFFKNAKACLPDKPGLPEFDVCLACLYYAKATKDDAFMQTDSQCGPCFAEYCWVPPS